MEKDDSTERPTRNSPAAEKEGDTPVAQKEDQEKQDSAEFFLVNTLTSETEENVLDIQKQDKEEENVTEKDTFSSPTQVSTSKDFVNTGIAEVVENAPNIPKEDQETENATEKNMLNSPTHASTSKDFVNTGIAEMVENALDIQKQDQEKENATEKNTLNSPTHACTSKEFVNTGIAEMVENALDIQKEDQEKENATEKNLLNSPTHASTSKDFVNTGIAEMVESALDIQKEDQEKENATEKNMLNSPTHVSTSENLSTITAEMEEKVPDIQKEDIVKENATEKSTLNSPTAEKKEGDTADFQKDEQEKEDSSEKNMANCPSTENLEGEKLDVHKKDQVEPLSEMKSLNISKESPEVDNEKVLDDLNAKMDESEELQSENTGGMKKNLEEFLYEEEAEPVFDGTEVPGMEANRSSSTRSLDIDPETGLAWPEKAVALTNFVREKSVVAVSSVLRRLSGKIDDGQNVPDDVDKTNNSNSNSKEVVNSPKESEVQKVSQRTVERSGWNPLCLIGISNDVDAENKAEQAEVIKELQPIAMKGRVILYTRLGCQDCRAARLFLHRKRLRYVEINIDVYPNRKLELEKLAGSSAVPKVFFNDILIGGLNELNGLDESGKLDEKIEYIVTEGPSFEAPLPPLSGEDDVSSSGGIDELAVIVQKMKVSVVVKDRFYKMRRFTNSFLGSEAVDFLSEDQYLEREEAIEFGRKLSRKLFFQHVLDENVFEDGNNLYRFLDHDPIVCQCQNIPRGIIDVKPKPIIEISSRLRFLSYAIFEAYTSEDGKHVDYRSIHGSEEFARYLRIVEELHRVGLQDMVREEKLAFFINLYNMMAIHAILVWGHPAGALERRKLFGDFKYVIGGCTYSLSAIHSGILRGNQRPPYTLTKPFGMKDQRFKVALPYPEPLVHFALVCGTRSGPALRCYSPGNIDKELVEAARDFLRSGGLILDSIAKVASVSKILKWYSVDFGKNEVEVLKHAANYLEPAESQAFLEFLASTQLKVVYQPYNWGLNY